MADHGPTSSRGMSRVMGIEFSLANSAKRYCGTGTLKRLGGKFGGSADCDGGLLCSR
jgi:hypothetical protein